MFFTGDFYGDCNILETYLDQIEFYAGTERRTGQFKDVKIKKGNGSMLYGLTWKGYLKKDKLTGENIFRKKDETTGLYLTKCRELYPELNDVFKEFGNKHFPEFSFTQVQLNKNYQCSRHKDGSNIGESILLTLGDYSGGNTIVECGNDYMELNSHYSLVKFNGSKYFHYTLPFTGTRYALVFFNNNKKFNPVLDQVEESD